jgi:hypothetical protein
LRERDKIKEKGRCKRVIERRGKRGKKRNDGECGCGEILKLTTYSRYIPISHAYSPTLE